MLVDVYPFKKNIEPTYSDICSEEYCCEPCQCNGDDVVCFAPTSPFNYGSEVGGCNPDDLPPGVTLLGIVDNITACGDYFGGISGGATSNSYFSNSNTQSDFIEYIYVMVIDGKGITTYRYPANTNAQAESYWNGIGKFNSENVLSQITPSQQPKSGAPCDESTENTICAIHSPSCQSDAPPISAAGTFGLYQLPGAYASEAAKGGQNFWDLFQETGQLPNWPFYYLPKNVVTSKTKTGQKN